MIRKIEPLILICFFLSGLAALVYEVSWLRLAGMYFESTAYSAATVVAIFMGGLALGSYLAGRVAEKSKDLVLLYFNLEAAIGLIALAIPWLFQVARPLFGVIYRGSYGEQFVYHLLRILLSAAIMMPAAVLMGLTLPILIKALTTQYSQLSRKSGLLYGVNAVGAATGAAVTGFLLLPALGTSRTTFVGVIINLGIAVAGWSALGRLPWSMTFMKPDLAAVKAALPTRRFILAVFSLSGFCALCYEIIWTRLLIANLGPASYSFATILSCFILGLAIGSTVYAALSNRIRDKTLSCGILLILTGLAATFATLFLPTLPMLASQLIARGEGGFGIRTLLRFMIAGMIVLPLTVFSGALFPAAASAYVPDTRRLSERIGRLYAGNSVGSIIGSLCAGFILLPLIGAHIAGLPVIILQFAMGLYVVVRSRGLRWAGYLVPVPVAAVLAIAILPGANPRLLFGGSYLYFWQYEESPGLDIPATRRELLYHKDGPGGTVTVMESPDGTKTFLAVDGKTEGSNDETDMTTQTMLAHLPLALHPDPKDVLVIGLGTGTTYAAALAHPVERVACVEISPQVIEAAEFFYRFWDWITLPDERGEVIVGDGRSLMFFSPDEFDIIIAEPSNPWLAGMSSLFTREYFEAMRERLDEGGVACQWIQGYRLGPESFKSILKTFAGVFPHVSLWWLNITGGDFILLGSEADHRFSIQRLDRIIEASAIKNYSHPQGTMTPYTFLRRFVAADDDLRRYAADGEVVTDDRGARLEAVAARDLYVQSVDMLHQQLSLTSTLPTPVIEEGDRRREGLIDTLAFYNENRRVYIQFMYRDTSPEPWSSPVYHRKKSDWRRDEDISVSLGRSLIAFADRLFLEGEAVGGDEVRQRLLQNVLLGYMEGLAFVPPRTPEYENLVHLYRGLGDLETSLRVADQAIREGKASARIYQMKGEVLYAMGSQHAPWASGLAQSSEEEAEAERQRAMVYLEGAREAFQLAARLEPDRVDHWLSLGVISGLLGDRTSAQRYLRRALEIDPNNETARRYLAALPR